MDSYQINKIQIRQLGPAQTPSPLEVKKYYFVDDGEQVLMASTVRELKKQNDGGPFSFEMAGPRRNLYFQPAATVCGIVSCGGLCPGMNDVIRSLVMTLCHGYGVPRIIGFRYGFWGLSAEGTASSIALSPETVKHIHEDGGTCLGSSRGPQDVSEMVRTLEKSEVKILFVIGGDGTMKGAAAIKQEIERRQLNIGIVCIPKTIDNDLEYVTRSFGFTTAVEEARKAIAAAHVEARGAMNGIGLVKLMGRHSGFIAAHAALSSGDVNFCLVPEKQFILEGEDGLLRKLELRLLKKHHAVIVVAEGAGQDLLFDGDESDKDRSGNVRLRDIGSFLQEKILSSCAEKKLDVTLKYIDPSYIIRSLPANALDSAFCMVLGQHASHAGMAGKTGMMVGHWNGHFTHVPLEMVVGRRRLLDDETWQRVLEVTG
ncbi:6-phosphofructokinase [Malonomonas rubra DSM 5091]|uniref:6-phosphofructokinase n=1 Tax=Malonomonas rubra DSM 5091 TaxID=1122189 RepID=A0A1M6KR91_MALRU|nr:ATP-dependent 6-phosphofructokinase [Malonomonas rubra]SHJ61457.1 6-phosphofructokinase [Malonomonas rubra DSM 5091]